MALESQCEYISFLRFVNDLSQTPSEFLNGHDDLADIINEISSKESRTSSENKLCQLVTLQDQIYKDWSVGFHWDLDTVLEGN